MHDTRNVAQNRADLTLVGVTQLLKTSNFNVGNNVWTMVPWDSAEIDNLSAWDSVGKTRIIVPNGVSSCRISVFTYWANNAADLRMHSCELNGPDNNAIARLVGAKSANISAGQVGPGSTCSHSRRFPLNGIQNISVSVIQGSGGTLALQGASNQPCYVEVLWYR